jgi:flagellar operon protein
MSDFRLPPSPVITGKPQSTGQQPRNQSKAATQSVDSRSFLNLLGQAVQQNTRSQTLTLSKHAVQRASQRGIELSGTDMERMGRAVDKAQGKGLTDTLIYMNNTAFIVNIPNKVVVTLMDSAEAQENVFTNINGAVIL